MPLTVMARAELSRLRRDIARIEGRLAEASRLTLDGGGRAASDGAAGTAASGDSGSGESGSGKSGSGESGGAPSAPAAPAREAAGEGRPDIGRRGRLALGPARLDAALGGGLPCAALTEIRAGQSRDGGAAAGFALALAARLSATGGAPSVVWVSEAGARREAGALYAPGLAALGLDPASVVEVAARTQGEALWAFEAALACRGVGVAVCELRRAALDLSATRRCALRARDSGVTGLLLRLGNERAEPSAAELRLLVAPAPAGTIGRFAAGVGRMAWRLTLEKSRRGRSGDFRVEWNAHERSFAERGAGSRAADPRAVPAAPLHRPPDPREGRRGRAA